MSELVPVRHPDDILRAYRGTPVADLLAYQNLGEVPRRYERAELLIGMCMDHRHVLRIPDNFAYVLRAGGANLRRMEFKVSFAIAVGGVRAACLIGHDQCGMVDLYARREAFVRGLVQHGGWAHDEAERHFDRFAPEFAIDDPVAFVGAEARRLRARFPGVVVAPLYYRLGEHRLYQVIEGRQ